MAKRPRANTGRSARTRRRCLIGASGSRATPTPGPELGHLGLGYGKIDTYDSGPITTYSANYSIRVFAQSSLTVSATRVDGGDATGRSIGVSLLIPLDGRVTATAATTHHAGHTDGYATVSKGLGIEAGSGLARARRTA